MAKALKRLKNHLEAKRLRGLALDIDETLSWTIGYWVERLLIKFGNPENLTREEIIAKYKYTQSVPYWQTEKALAWMEKARKNDKLQEELPLIENSNHIVQRINKIIPVVAYITNRPQSVIQGTRNWLKKHNFPQVDIMARPDNVSHVEGNKWKAKVLQFLYPEVMGIIDDNAGLIENLSNDYKGTVYLYDNADYKRRDIKVIPCKTWKDVLNQVEKSELVLLA